MLNMGIYALGLRGVKVLFTALKFFNKPAELCKYRFRFEIHRPGAFSGDPITCKEAGYLHLSTMREISVNKIPFGAIIDKGASLPADDGSFKIDRVRLFLWHME
jgi:hypothetical protein